MRVETDVHKKIRFDENVARAKKQMEGGENAALERKPKREVAAAKPGDNG
jgi:hypothetical protein